MDRACGLLDRRVEALGLLMMDAECGSCRRSAALLLAPRGRKQVAAHHAASITATRTLDSLLTRAVGFVLISLLFYPSMNTIDVHAQEPAPESARQLPGERVPTREPDIREREADFIPIRDRWRIGYGGRLYDPYNQNVLQGDFPIFGQQTLFAFTVIS